MIVSVHLPKTAGTSFKKSLQEYYGRTLLEDYGDAPMNLSSFENVELAKDYSNQLSASSLSKINCIHGHFLPLKYAPLQQEGWKFVVWLRNPIERLMSNYLFWMRTYVPGKTRGMKKDVVEGDWTFYKYATSNKVRNLYTKFLSGFGLDKFEFVGIVEFYKEDFEYFCYKYFGKKLPEFYSNVTPPNLRSVCNITKSERDEIEKLHQDDMDMYKNALTLRKNRV